MNYPNIGYVYSYDQLNRLTGQMAFTDLDTAGNEWGTASAVDDYKENVWYDPNGNITSYMRHGTTLGGSMDEMTYNYGYGSNNQLSHVDDAISAGTYPADIDDQADSNYTYDASGNLIGDASEGITNDWTTAGKLQRVTKTGMVIEFRYDAMGNRVSKNVTDNTDSVTTYYVRDAQDNVMAVYKYADNAAELRLKELHMYGSSRVGIRQEDELIWCQSCTLSVPPVTSAWAGRQIYELTNHLGNVLTTISDKKVHFDNNNDNIADWSVPEIISQNDYYPGGMLQPGRTFSSSDYRFGLNGQEKVQEIKGYGNHCTAKFWEYDARTTRRWNLDPKPNANTSEYSTFSNNPILFSDPLGDTVKISGFSERKILNDLAKGLNVSKKENPFFFDKDKKLQINDSKTGNLSSDQKKILHNIKGVIDSDVLFTIKESKNDEIIPGAQAANKATVTVFEAGGAATFPNLGPDGRPDFSGNSGVTIFWNGKAGANFYETNGNKLKEPKYSILYHELGGHGYFRYVEKFERIFAGGLAIDYENIVRGLHKLPYRRYDETHLNPMVPIRPIRISDVK